MTAEDVVAALALPASCRINRRVPKTLWPHELRAAAGDAVEELRWLAVLRPDNCAIAAADGADEIQVLSLDLRPGAKPAALAARLQKAVPYPVVLIVASSPGLALAAGGEFCDLQAATSPCCLPALSLARQNRASLATVYAGWAAAVQRMAEPARLQAEIAKLRSRAAKEKRISALVALNLELQKLQSEFVAAQAKQP